MSRGEGTRTTTDGLPWVYVGDENGWKLDIEGAQVWVRAVDPRRSRYVTVYEDYHTAQQRAVRVVLVRNPARLVSLQEHMKRGGEAMALPFTKEEGAEIATHVMIYLDAIALGWKAKELTDAE